MTMQKPQLMSYLSIHHYLEDLYRYRKETEPSFTYELWAQEIGIKNRAFLKQLVSGRRALTETTIQLFIVHLNLDHSEKEYFHLLVLYSRARSQTQRDLYGRKLRQLIKTEYIQSPINDYKSVVASTLFPRLLALLTFKDVPKTLAGMGGLLNVSEDEVSEALEKISRLGIIENGTDGWTTKGTAFKISDYLGDDDLLNYHKQSLMESIAARNLPQNERRYRSLVIPLNEDDFIEFINDMNSFVKETLKKYDVDNLDGRKLFQINFNIHSVSATAEKEQEKAHDCAQPR